MAKLTSLQELTGVREQVRREIKVRQETGTVIYIGMGTCGIAAGAKDTMLAIQQELAKRQIDARVASVGCIGMCVKEPLVDIQQAGRSHVLYANVQPEMVPRLIQEHLIKGEPVNEWVICRMPGE
ncbi:MAG: (2Fe-2S) ferredoxin domain-containing protein [Bacillota bacterium]